MPIYKNINADVSYSCSTIILNSKTALDPKTPTKTMYYFLPNQPIRICGVSVGPNTDFKDMDLFEVSVRNLTTNSPNSIFKGSQVIRNWGSGTFFRYTIFVDSTSFQKLGKGVLRVTGTVKNATTIYIIKCHDIYNP